MLLAKYKPTDTVANLCHLLDILCNKRLFLASVSSLNDPLEGCGVNLQISGYAGMGIMRNNDLHPGPVKEALDGFRVASLAADARNVQMWAHYANSFRGACVCFSGDGALSIAEKVEYVDTPMDQLVIRDGDLASAARESLLIKQSEWSYEREYRIVRPVDSEADISYVQLGDDDVCAVVVGQFTGEPVCELLRVVCEMLGIPLYTTMVRELSNRIEIVPFGFKREFAGEDLDSQIACYCESNGLTSFEELERSK